MRPDPDPTDPTPGMQIWGWMSPVELRWLASAADRMDSVVEIGCLHGRSAFALATGCSGPVVCIDPWDDDQDQSFGSFMAQAGFLPNVYPVRGRSPDVLEREFPCGSFPLSVIAETGWPQFDMTFIDGAHAYESVLADICAWMPHTRWLICGHDYCNEDAGYPGVAQAVNEVFGDRVVVPEGTSIWTVDLSEDRSLSSGLPEGQLKWVDEYDRPQSYDFSWRSR